MHTSPPTRRRAAALAALVALALATAACGDDDDVSPPDSTAGAADVTTPATTVPAIVPGTTEPAADAPSAIVSLSPSATEILYAIDAGDQVLAVDDFSNYPPETADKMQGINAFQPNVEAIAGLEPDLVISDGTNPDLLAQLDTLGIAHWEDLAPSTLDDVYAKVEQLGAEVGRIGEAAELVGEMQTDIAAVLDDLPELEAPLTYYHELDDTYFTAGADSFISAVYGLVGLENIITEAGSDLGQYPQLNAEFIVESDPELIFLACTKYCSTTADSIAARPGWEAMTAVENGGVIEMDDDIVSRWGPRLVDFLESVGEAVATVSQPVG